MNGDVQMNEEMAEKLSQATTVAEVQAIANSYGYELTMEQAQEVFDKVQSFSADGELSDDMLEAVTGGTFSVLGGEKMWTPDAPKWRTAWTW